MEEDELEVAAAAAAAAAIDAVQVVRGVVVPPPPRPGVPTLESLALDRYLLYLESECVTYIALSQAPGLLLKGLAPRLLFALKLQLATSMSGLASSVLREKMLDKVLSEVFPTERYSKRAALLQESVGGASFVGPDSVTGNAPLASTTHAHSHALHALGATCISPSCSGAFIAETMATVLVNPDVRQLVFTAGRMPSAAAAASAAAKLKGGSLAGAMAAAAASSGVAPYGFAAGYGPEFNVAAVIAQLVRTTRECRLERLVFSESFVRECDNEVDTNVPPILNPGFGSKSADLAAERCRDFIHSNLRRQQDSIAQSLSEGGDPEGEGRFGLPCCDIWGNNSSGSGNGNGGGVGGSSNNDSARIISTRTLFTGDRRGLVITIFLLFRDPSPLTQFSRLRELVLKNNIQCSLYSKANFQFELLARVGFTCPSLRVLDLFGTDTWADCLVAFFFRDAFHSIHRYLFFMENEEDESSAYHPHDLNRYCQFCLDQSHPNTIEKPFTVNPVIPLVDEIYDHVIKRYPKRSYCILRNCIKVTELLESATSEVFELLRPRGRSCCCCNPRKSVKVEDCKRPQESSLPPPRRSARLRTKQNCQISSSISQIFVEQKFSERKEIMIAKASEIKTSMEEDDDKVYLGVLTRSKKRKMVKEEDFQHITVIPKKSPRINSSPEASQIGPPAPLASSSSGRPNMAALKKKKTSAASAKAGNNSSGENKNGKSCYTPKYLSESEPVDFEEWKRTLCFCCCREEKGELKEDPVECRVSKSLKKAKRKRRKKDKDQQTFCCFHNSEQNNSDPNILYRRIRGWPHLNECVKRLEVLNVGGTNVLGEFVPFVLMCCPRLQSLGQWINTGVYGLEILHKLGVPNRNFPNMREFSYNTDRNYFCQPYIGFVPEAPEFKNVRREMVRFSGRISRRLSSRSTTSGRARRQRGAQLRQDCRLMAAACPNMAKLNLVIHYKFRAFDEEDEDDVHNPWEPLADLPHLIELDLVTMRFCNVRLLLHEIGSRLTSLTLEMDDEQGQGSEIVFLGRFCPNLTALRILLGDKVLKGEMTLHFGSQFFRKLERLTVEGSVHLHAFAFLWGHCRRLCYMKMGFVVSNEVLHTNVLIHDVFTLLFQVNGMSQLMEFHIRNLRIRSLLMGTFLLDNLPSLRRASNWILDMTTEEAERFKSHLTSFIKDRGLSLDYKEW